MGSYVESAYYGDEKEFKNITGILADKIVGTTLNVDVDEKLIPPFVVAPKTELDSQEEAKIRGRASSSCGGNDQECIERTESRMRQEALLEKERASTSPVNTIKGRRLTVNIIDSSGRRRRIVVPDGQKFSLDDVMANDPKKGKFQVPPLEYFRNQMYIVATIVLITAIGVFGVLATYSLFSRVYGPFVAVPLSVIAVIIPYSGYFMILIYFTGVAAAKKYVELSSG